MTRVWILIIGALAIGFLVAPAPAAGPGATVTVRNPVSIARPAETIVLSASELQKVIPFDDIRRVRVRDTAQREALTQAVDLNDDGKFEELLFQTDLAPAETKTFELSVGERQAYKREDFKAYGRFVRERRDDFAWENDRIAHRMYGAALETWAQEPLTSSAVDVWTKRVRRLVINDWYMLDDYHRDNGDGGDFYSAGKSRGCGGNGIWDGARLYPSANFRDTRVLANGPIRVMFELTYLSWDAGATKVAEMKRITLDAGQNIDRFESHYKVEGARPLMHAVGIKKAAGSTVVSSREKGWLRTWETLKGNGQLGCAIIMDPAVIAEITEADGNYLVAARVPREGPAVYYAGFGWDKSGDFGGVDDWERYVDQSAQRLRAPVAVSLKVEASK
jgi:Domain of unknown function (DUF4861)